MQSVITQFVMHFQIKCRSLDKYKPIMEVWENYEND